MLNENYKLVWSEEFDGNELDRQRWSLRADMQGLGDITLLDDESIIKVEDSNLKLRSVAYNVPNNEDKKYAVTYSVTTKESMSYLYGYIEMRARVPYKNGCWPSFWMKSIGALNSVNKEYFTEIDVFEVFGSPEGFASNLHKWYIEGENKGKHTQVISYGHSTWYPFENYENLSNEYHIYGFEWTPDMVRMFIDGHISFEFDINDNFDGISDMSGFHQPIYLIMNNHLFTEKVPHRPSGKFVTPEDLPGEYDIDYIRLYQIPGVGQLNIK